MTFARNRHCPPETITTGFLKSCWPSTVRLRCGPQCDANTRPEKWADKQEEQAAVYANRQRIGGHRGKQLLRRRGEMVERTFAHAYETGALRRLYVRGKQNVQKRLLLQAAACNLALLLRKMIGAGTPRALQDVVARSFFIVLRLLSTINAISVPPRSLSACMSRRISHRGQCVRWKTRCQKLLI